MWLQRIASLALIALFLWIAAINAAIVWLGVVRKQRGTSLVPIAGGLLGFLGFATSPIHWMRWLCWLPLLIDFGCVPEVMLFLWRRKRS